MRVCLLAIVTVAAVAAVAVGCGGPAGNSSGCPSGVACGSGCCPASDQACVIDPTSGSATCELQCNTRSDCGSDGCCAPAQDESGNLVGPYICQSANACCYDNACPNIECCVTDNNENEFCALPCSASGSDTCAGATSCQAYNFTNGVCTGPTACGPE